jgi:hypothetical protein
MVYQSNLPSQTLFDSGVISLCFTSGFRFKLSQISGGFCKILGNVGTSDRIGFALKFLVIKGEAKATALEGVSDQQFVPPEPCKR